MISRSEGLAVVVERTDAVYLLPSSGPWRLQPLALEGPAAVLFAALEAPQDRHRLQEYLASAYPDRPEHEVARATADALSALLEADLVVETPEDASQSAEAACADPS